MRPVKPLAMALRTDRTLVKSPPELWELVDDPELMIFRVASSGQHKLRRDFPSVVTTRAQLEPGARAG